MITDTEYITYEPAEGIKKFDASVNKYITLLNSDELVRNMYLIFSFDYIKDINLKVKQFRFQIGHNHNTVTLKKSIFMLFN